MSVLSGFGGDGIISNGLGLLGGDLSYDSVDN